MSFELGEKMGEKNRKHADVFLQIKSIFHIDYTSSLGFFL